MEADCLAAGWTRTESHDDADLIVVRGCSVTARAQRECERFIERMKQRHPFAKIHVCGCMKDASRTSSTAIPTPARSAAAIPTRTARAYLKVQDGCSGKCTFCIVPQFRGKPSSVPFETALDKAKRLIESGYHEIVVTGCNLALYANRGRGLPDLLDALSGLTDPEESQHCRIRIGSLPPGPCTAETVALMAERKNICKFLHMTVQSGSSTILSAMRRGYKATDVDELISKTLKLMPDIGLGCDLITGFPGELETDFLATKGLLKRFPFSNVHIFPFSERHGTIAAGFPYAIPTETRRERAHALSNLAAAKRLTFARKFVGKTVEMVVENEEKKSGWTSEYLMCHTDAQVTRKSALKVVVTRVHRNATLEGRLA